MAVQHCAKGLPIWCVAERGITQELLECREATAAGSSMLEKPSATSFLYW